MSNFPSIGIVGLVATVYWPSHTRNASLFFDHIFAKPFGRLKFLAREVRQVGVRYALLFELFMERKARDLKPAVLPL
jgi:hypothetical protein